MTLYSKLEKHLPRENMERVRLLGGGTQASKKAIGFNQCKAQYDEV